MQSGCKVTAGSICPPAWLCRQAMPLPQHRPHPESSFALERPFGPRQPFRKASQLTIGPTPSPPRPADRWASRLPCAAPPPCYAAELQLQQLFFSTPLQPPASQPLQYQELPSPWQGKSRGGNRGLTLSLCHFFTE